MKKVYFGTNLKMYKNIQETVTYLQKLVSLTRDIPRTEIELFVIPSYTSLSKAVECIDRSLVKLGAQNMCWEEQGQFTGEISPLMLKELELDMVMIGHSERRHVFQETDQQERKKVAAALEHDLTTLLCVGETGEQKELGISEEVIRSQLKIGLKDIDEKQVKKVWIAYEPVWSIGVNGIPATAEYAESIHIVIKQCLSEIFGEEGKEIPVLYGGSVNQDNSKDLIAMPSIDGLFVGRSAWEAVRFEQLIREALVIRSVNS